MSKNKKLVLIDGHALLFRAYYAFPPLTTTTGEVVGAIYGFASILLTVIRELKPTHLAVSFDLAKPTFRHITYKEYKANRDETPKELIRQEKRLRQVVKFLNIPIYEKSGFEADDVIGTLVNIAKKQAINSIIVTGDLDALQLVDDSSKGTVRVYTPSRGKKPALIYQKKDVKKRFNGLSPNQIIDYKALAGDASDNIPGIKGIGPKTAISLLNKFSTLKNLYQKLENKSYNLDLSNTLLEKLTKNKKIAFLSQDLATIRTNVPIEFKIEDCAINDFDKIKATRLFKKLGFKSLIKKLPNDKFEQKVQDALF